jgi:hypothetical protein
MARRRQMRRETVRAAGLFGRLDLGRLDLGRRPERHDVLPIDVRAEGCLAAGVGRHPIDANNLGLAVDRKERLASN